MLHHEEKAGPPGSTYRNILVVYDLFTTADQQQQFFNVIKKIATSVLSWESVVYLDPETSRNLFTTLTEQGRNAFLKAIYQRIGASSADELYVSRSWQSGNVMLLNAFASAVKICYGDSIGVFFSEQYFSDKNWKTRFRLSSIGQYLVRARYAFKSALSHPARKPLLGTLNPIEFDLGYFSLRPLSGLPPFRYEIMDMSLLKQRFSSILANMEIGIPSLMRNAGQIKVLLTSNFSEAARTSLEGELASYIAFVGPPDGVETLIIKPHPRDTASKIDTLRQKFEALGYTVLLLNDPIDFYIPFELFMLKLEDLRPHGLDGVAFYSVSSACLSLWFLFGVRPMIGLGEDLVKKHFETDQVESRLSHEKDLRALVPTT